MKRMATLMMTSEGHQPVFHDFLGMSRIESATVLGNKNSSSGFVSEAYLGGGGGGEIPVSVAGGGSTVVTTACSDLGSERQAGNNFEAFPKSDFSGPEISNRFSGKKRSNSDTSFVIPMRDRVLQGTNALDNSCLVKIFGDEGSDGRQGRPPDDEVFFAMQPPKPTSNAPRLLQSLMNSRTDLIAPKWSPSISMNAEPHYRSRFGHGGAYVDKASANSYWDASVGPPLITRPAADEGSRTGIKGSGIANVVPGGGGGAERNSSGILPGINRPRVGPQNAEHEAAKPSSHHTIAYAGQQMTIFYAGQAHVFDDVHPKKADAIMAFAGSSGRSWSTTYSSKSSAAYMPNKENETGGSNLVFSHALSNSIPVAANASLGFNLGGRLSSMDNQNIPSGGHQGAGSSRETKPTALTPTAEQGSEGKREEL